MKRFSLLVHVSLLSLSWFGWPRNYLVIYLGSSSTLLPRVDWTRNLGALALTDNKKAGLSLLARDVSPFYIFLSESFTRDLATGKSGGTLSKPGRCFGCLMYAGINMLLPSVGPWSGDVSRIIVPLLNKPFQRSITFLLRTVTYKECTSLWQVGVLFATDSKWCRGRESWISVGYIGEIAPTAVIKGSYMSICRSIEI